jgi:hypothetical protein
MNRTALIAAIILAAIAPAARGQQAAVPTAPKPVHPTPIPATGCRGCTDATPTKATTVSGYDDKGAVTTTRKTSAPAKKVKPKHTTVSRSRVKAKTSSKTRAPKSTATPKKKLSVQHKHAVLDPLVVPQATTRRDTVRK